MILPIIKKWRGYSLAMGGNVSKAEINKVHQLDIAPTILNLLNVKIPEYMSGKVIDLN